MAPPLHPDIQKICEIPSGPERFVAMGHICDMLDEERIDYKYEVYYFGAGALFSDLIDIINEQQKYINKLEADHEETISDLLHNTG
jgi:hypothetical protein